MRILGIDPGYATIGFGLIEGERAQYRMVTYGAITTPAGLPLSKRLYQIDRDMEELIGQLKTGVGEVAIKAEKAGSELKASINTQGITPMEIYWRMIVLIVF